ncbi:vitamin K epoxide reductase family protein [Saliphagus infecundisoli]|uniref:Vitamin K epoxide reductase family protein n=1 Tax=Saliphagus infecundisoli TaxID=1849069 RepID=A0ABD5QI82_9EURY|nr:vitamin K epoxide reductase family protein [Saliphagus infecundisoli]
MSEYHGSSSDGTASHHEESHEPGTMMLQHPTMETWPQYPIIILGLWLLASPFTFGYESLAMTVSDIISGTILIVLAAMVLVLQSGWANYANGFVGLWLLLAPLLFWAPTSAAYLNNTLVGVFVITFAVLVVMRMEMSGPDVPRGWTYNPSTAAQRAPILIAALIGFFFSMHMTTYQIGYTDFVFEPFFGQGTVNVLTSDISEMFPVSDAGLGAVAYAIEVLMVFMGDKRRWRTMPWMVTLFGIVVIPLGFVSIILIILQPLAVGSWCALCLLSALAMLFMIALTVDEVVAMGQFLYRRTREGESLWRAFWMGGTFPESEAGVNEKTRSDAGSPRSMFWGLTTSWYLVVATGLGLWLMASPAILGTTGGAANSNQLVGALAVTFSVIAMGEPARIVRFINVPLGIWIIVAPWILTGASTLTLVNSLAVGVLLVLISIPRGTIRDNYGAWDRIAKYSVM